jgi:hypothetical protein
LVNVAGTHHIDRTARIALNQGSPLTAAFFLMFVFFSLSVPLLDIAPPVNDVPAVIFTLLHSICVPLFTLNTRIPLPVILVFAQVQE